MPKINREEYEMLKGLDERWKWIARDKNNTLVMGAGKNERYLDGWFPPVNVGDSLVVDETNAVKDASEYGNLFQFIQWEDEEPYNVAELIEDYEYSAEHVSYVVNERVKALGKAWRKLFKTPNESEETEVKKDKKWFVDKWTKERNKTDVHDPMYHFINEFIADVNQLDEPEVLSQEWISENVEYAYFDMLDGSGRLSSATAIIKPEKLKNLLVPKESLGNSQELEKVQIPQSVADYFLDYDGNGIDLFDYILKNQWNEDAGYDDTLPKNVEDWIFKSDDNIVLALALSLGNLVYEVEEEQKYYVRLGEKMYFAGWYETDATFVFDDSPNSLERAKTYNLKDGKEKVKELGTGELVKVEEVEE